MNDKGVEEDDMIVGRGCGPAFFWSYDQSRRKRRRDIEDAMFVVCHCHHLLQNSPRRQRRWEFREGRNGSRRQLVAAAAAGGHFSAHALAMACLELLQLCFEGKNKIIVLATS